ncbi:MAG TPA: hypothetical protein VIJ35_15900, partial [Bradyrhizobium sp.]
MTGSTKQSIKRQERKDGLLRRFAPRNDVILIPKTASRSRGAVCPRFASEFVALSNQRAQGMPG